jgi:uncharacterized protein with HEPN domain
METVKSARSRLLHIIQNIDGILNATEGVEPQQVIESYVLMRALERAIQIISEASKELPSDLRAFEPGIPWRDVIGIGNILRHEYHRVRDETLLAILTDQLPELRRAALRLLDRAGE